MGTRLMDGAWQVTRERHKPGSTIEEDYPQTLCGALRLNDDIVVAKCMTMADGVDVEDISFRVNFRAFVVLHYDACVNIPCMTLREKIPFSFDRTLPADIMAVCDVAIARPIPA